MRVLSALVSPWRRAGEEVLSAIQAVLDRPGSESLAIGSIMLFALLGWFVYVPIHELLHAFGCMVAGGSVYELQIAPLYGGALLERVFPFVEARGDYAGRLTGFDTHGSDLVYLMTDFAPFIVTVMFASAALGKAVQRRSAVLLGIGTVLYVGPAISVIGDYYEMGSIVVSRLVEIAFGPLIGEQALQLRHDDLFLFIGEFAVRFADHQGLWAVAAALSFLAGLALVTLTFAASQTLARTSALLNRCW